MRVSGIWLLLAFILIGFKRFGWRHFDQLYIVGLPLVYALFSIGLTHYEGRYVRYVPLTYLFSFVILLQWLADYLKQRWHVLHTILATVFVCTLFFYLSHELTFLL